MWSIGYTHTLDEFSSLHYLDVGTRREVLILKGILEASPYVTGVLVWEISDEKPSMVEWEATQSSEDTH